MSRAQHYDEAKREWVNNEPADTTKYLKHVGGLCSDTSDANIETQFIPVGSEDDYKNCDSFWKIEDEKLVLLVTDQQQRHMYHDLDPKCAVLGKWWADETHTLLMVHLAWASKTTVRHDKGRYYSNRYYTTEELISHETVRFFQYKREYVFPTWRKVNAGDEVVKIAFQNCGAVSILAGLQM